ncbi:MAG: phenylacetate--CoA ligase family protein [Candidatus Omnitrophica bacterium]|nr:phenylacetate--CoA ligase family protein [Candidatus Omnitrophota bacterium]
MMMFNAQALKQVSQLLKSFPSPGRRRVLRSWRDFQQLPVTSREDIKAYASGGLRHAFNITATSGSTSSRMIIAHSRQAYEAHLGRLVMMYRHAGIKPGVLCLNLCSYELNSGGRMMETAFKAAGAGVIPLGPISSPEKVHEAARLVRLLKPRIVNAYTNQLFDLFSVLGRRHSIRRCLVNGEPLWPDYRRRMEKMGGVSIHDHYGAMEISGLALALKAGDDSMRVFAQGLLLEVLAQPGEASPTGTGDLLVTDLNNTSMPFVRYRLGDRVELLDRRGALAIKVLGRTQESLLVNGVVVDKEALIRTVNNCLGTPCFFFLIDKHRLQYYDKLIINVAADRIKPSVCQVVVKALGLDNCVELRKHEGTLPRTLNGKIRYFIDARTKAQ